MDSESSTSTTETILSQLETLATAANKGKAEVLPAIHELLGKHPQLWEHFGDLTKHVEAKWRGCKHRSENVAPGGEWFVGIKA